MGSKRTQAEIQRTSAHLRRLLTGLLVSLSVLLVLERFGAVGMQLLRHGPTSEALRRLGLALVAACPEVVFLVALWWIRQALAAFAAGKFYTPTISRMLDRVGTMLAAGAFISVFLIPSASRALGFGPGYVIDYDVSGLVLGAVGLSLKVIAHVLRRAAEMEAELDGIF
jgi:hypothetical protein